MKLVRYTRANDLKMREYMEIVRKERKDMEGMKHYMEDEIERRMEKWKGRHRRR